MVFVYILVWISLFYDDCFFQYLYNRLDCINKIKTGLGKELADSVLFIKTFDDTHNGFVNLCFTSGFTVLFRNAGK